MSPETRSYAAPPLGKLKTWGLIAVVVGIVGVLVGFLVDPGNLARAALIGGVYWVGISLGCLGLLMIQHLTGGDWGVVLRRVLEAGAKAVVLPAVLLVPVFLFGMEALYPWAHFDPAEGRGEATHGPVEEGDVASLAPAALAHDADTIEPHGVAGYVAENHDFLQHKAPYLNVSGFWLRFAGYFVVWLLLAYWLWGLSKKQDARPDPRINKRAQAISAPGLILLALTASFASYDWLMSIFPTWYSTMYGVWFIGTCGIGALSILVLMGAFLGRREPLVHVLQPRHFHDWGKLLFAFVVLWAYFSVSQFLIIWSGNLPDEIAFFLPRFRGGWLVVTSLLFILHFALPFAVLLSRDLKRHARRLAWVALFLLVMRWVDLMWQVAPSIEVIWDEAVANLWWMSLAATLAVGGLWLWWLAAQLGKHPIVPVGDPYLEEAMAHEHAH